MENIKKIKEMLMSAIFEVFEKMFYVFSEPLQSNDEKYHMRSVISFHGPVSGEIQLYLDRAIAETMVKNMLNFDEDEVNDAILADCMKESLNMICGNFLRKLDPDRVFHLSIPTFNMIPEDIDVESKKEEQVVRLSFVSDNGRMKLVMKAPALLA